MMEKLNSRKLWFAVVGCIVAIALIVIGAVQGNADFVTLGSQVLAAAVIGYFVVEGGADWLAIIFENLSKPKTSVTATTSNTKLVEAAMGVAKSDASVKDGEQ